jgi:hypothetical protein
MRVTYRNMTKTTYLKDQHGYPMDSQDLLIAMGLTKSHAAIPPDYMDARRIGEVLVLILPQSRKGKDGLPNRRVVAECPRCAAFVCAGHLHQHVGQRTCLDGSVRARQARAFAATSTRGADHVLKGE